MRFKNKTIIVTGGTRGIGRSVTLGFAREGAHVFATYRHRHDAARVLMEQNGNPAIKGSIEAIQASVTDINAIRRMVREIKQSRGNIDILVNNAGILNNGYLATMKSSDCDEMIDINLKGVIYASMAVARIMIGQRCGQIINMSSLSAFRDFSGTAIYSASKAGIAAFTGCLAKELSYYGIVVCGLAPGLVNSEMTSDMDNACLEEYKKNTRLQKIMEPEEIANWVMNLASDNASIMNGETLILGG